jgi:Family of unknown function (DUF5670)
LFLLKESCWLPRPAPCARLRQVNSPPALLHPTHQATGQAILEKSMLWTIFAILLLMWLFGWGFHVAGGLIHLVLVIALLVLVIQLITGRRAAV